MAESILIKALQGRTEELSSELQTVREELKELQGKEQSLAHSLDAYKMALQAELGRNGNYVPAPEMAEAESPTSSLGSDAGATQDAGVGKTDFIFQAVKSSQSLGISAVDIWKAILEAKITMKRSYIYAVLGRLVASKKIQVGKDGRYYPIRFPR